MTYVIKTKPDCPYCVKAKELLSQTGEEVIEQVYDTPVKVAHFKVGERFATFPQVFHNGTLIGGCDDLQRYLNDDDF